MKLSAPSTVMFLISLALVILGAIGRFAPAGLFSTYAFAFVFIGYAILAVGCLLKGA